MDAGDLAALIIAVSTAVAVGGLLLALASITRAATAFRRSVDEVTRRTLPLIDDAHAAVRQADADLVKVDALLETAASISRTADSASRLAYAALVTPLVKLVAFASGAATAVGRLRARRSAAPGLPAPRTDRQLPRPPRALGR